MGTAAEYVALVTKPDLSLTIAGHAPPGRRLSPSSSFHASQNSSGGWAAEILTTDTRTLFEIRFDRET